MSDPAAPPDPAAATPVSDGDHALLAAYVRRRDADAFSVLVDRHQGDLLRLAHALLGDAHAAQDAVQEGFLRLCREADRLLAGDGSHAGLGGWLCTVVRNQCLDQLRRRAAARVQVLAEESLGAPGPDGAPAEAPRAVWTAVDDLPALERAAVLLRYRDQLSYREIADRLGKSVTHIGVILHQALGRLRQSPVLRQEALP